MIKEQSTINATADLLVNRLRASYNRVSWVRFGSKQCWVSECINNRYFLVKSYNTWVAIIDDQNGELFELGKYSVTASKQVTQLFNLPDTESYRNFGFSKLNTRYLVK